MRRAVLAMALCAAASAQAAPAAGRYAGQLCVATSPGGPPSCGAAEVEVRPAGRVDVRVADIVYRLALRSSQLDVTTMHGRLQVDEFSSPYEWAADGAAEALRFADEAKAVRYEVRLGMPQPR